jgi:hypothetical protein
MRFIRNALGFLFGVLLVSGCSALINTAYAVTEAELTNAMDVYTLETNSIITTSVLGLAFCLGWVAGSFR